MPVLPHVHFGRPAAPPGGIAPHDRGEPVRGIDDHDIAELLHPHLRERQLDQARARCMESRRTLYLLFLVAERVPATVDGDQAGSEGAQPQQPVRAQPGYGRGCVVAIKKSKLYRSLWASCDELRGGMDASQYKDYILTLLFVKYVSDQQQVCLV